MVKLGNHKNLVGFAGVSINENELWVITEFCHGGTLFDLLHRRKEIVLTWKQRIKMALDVAEGMRYLHA